MTSVHWIPLAFCGGIREAVRRLLGRSRRELKADRARYGWRDKVLGSAWQVGPTVFPAGGRGCETGAGWGGSRKTSGSWSWH